MIQLTNLKDIKAALKLGPVFCDITAPAANGLPVRDVRKFKKEGLHGTDTLSQTEYISRFSQGLRVSYEVLVLEGWHVPERVYTK